MTNTTTRSFLEPGQMLAYKRTWLDDEYNIDRDDIGLVVSFDNEGSCTIMWAMVGFVTYKNVYHGTDWLSQVETLT